MPVLVEKGGQMLRTRWIGERGPSQGGDQVGLLPDEPGKGQQLLGALELSLLQLGQAQKVVEMAEKSLGNYSGYWRPFKL